jgi:hypothetical protein
MRTRLLIMTIATGVCSLPAAASAEIVTATFTGSVTSVLEEGGEGLPPASEGDPLVATYVFDTDQAGAVSTMIGPTGGFIGGLYYSFVTATVSVNGVFDDFTAGPFFDGGELDGETDVFNAGSIVGASILGTGTLFESSVTGTDFAYPLTLTPTPFSYNPTDADQTSIYLSDDVGDIIESDISNVSITVAAPPPPPPVATPEPSTWAMMLIGFLGIGVFAYRRGRVAASAAV